MTSACDWNGLLDELEASIADAECGGTARVVELDDVVNGFGPLPPDLLDRAQRLEVRARRLSSRLEGELAAIEGEMDRIAPRTKSWVSPAPSHLDQMA